MQYIESISPITTSGAFSLEVQQLQNQLKQKLGEIEVYQVKL